MQCVQFALRMITKCRSDSFASYATICAALQKRQQKRQLVAVRSLLTKIQRHTGIPLPPYTLHYRITEQESQRHQLTITNPEFSSSECYTQFDPYRCW